MRTTQLLSTLALLALPWLNPYAPGPSAAVGPLLFAWLCASLVIGLAVWRDARLVAWSWLVAALVSAAFGRSPAMSTRP